MPQNRERVFIIGHLRGKGGRKVFPIEETNGYVGVPINRIAHSKYFRRVLQTYNVNSSVEALDTMQGGNRQPCVRVIGNTHHSGKGKNIANTLTCSCNQGTLEEYRIRKLTPKECWRLQGWDDESFERAASVCSNSQLYKQAGNGVTVNVIYEIAKRLE